MREDPQGTASCHAKVISKIRHNLRIMSLRGKRVSTLSITPFLAWGTECPMPVPSVIPELDVNKKPNPNDISYNFYTQMLRLDLLVFCEV